MERQGFNDSIVARLFLYWDGPLLSGWRHPARSCLELKRRRKQSEWNDGRRDGVHATSGAMSGARDVACGATRGVRDATCVVRNGAIRTTT